jgi:hypothetical protein
MKIQRTSDPLRSQFLGMRRLAPRFLLAIALLFPRGRAVASSENIMQIYQPTEVDGPGVIASIVTYVGYQPHFMDWAGEVLYTTRPNAILCDGKPQNRNAASKLGIFFVDETVPSRSGFERVQPRLSGDTLKVVLDATAVRIPPDNPPGLNAYRDWDEEVLSLTLWSGLRNARVRWPKIRFVEYTVRGERFLRRRLPVGSHFVSGEASASLPRFSPAGKEQQG